MNRRRHRRLLLFFGLFAGIAIAVLLATWLLWPHPSITRENAAKLTKGMTLSEIEALLGGPERIKTTGPTEGDADDNGDDGPDAERLASERFLNALTHTARSHRSRIDSTKHTWGSDSVAIFVVFDADQRVIDFAVRPLRRAPESPLDKLCRWLGL
jgi:hypothetical protein